MQAWIDRYFSIDDLWSVVGYGFLIGLARVMNAQTEIAVASMLASGMLAVFWLASKNVRERNRERDPNVRVLVWGLVAAVSLSAAVWM